MIGKIIYKYFKDKYGKRSKSLVYIIKEDNYTLEETNHNGLMSEKYKKTCEYLDYFGHLFILISTVTFFVSISAFASLVLFLLVLRVLQ